jgi:hypothetical protein
VGDVYGLAVSQAAYNVLHEVLVSAIGEQAGDLRPVAPQRVGRRVDDAERAGYH